MSEYKDGLGDYYVAEGRRDYEPVIDPVERLADEAYERANARFEPDIAVQPVIDPAAWDRVTHDLRFGWRISYVRRWVWPPEVHRRLYPIMCFCRGSSIAPSDARHWGIAAYGNSIFIGPLTLTWKSKP
jgi:hypothetical protein